MWAAKIGNHKAVHLLLEAGADPNARDMVLNTPLIRAAMSESVLCVKLLLQAGADPHITNKRKFSALHYAAEYSDNKEILQCLITAGVDLEGRDNWGGTPLGKAAARNKIQSVKLLLDCGANIDCMDIDNDTSLYESLVRHHDNMTELLLSRGATYILSPSSGGSILHLAALSGGLRTLEVLYTAALRGINIEATDRQGKTALQLAQQREGKEEGFLEKFHELLVDIRTRNATQAPETSYMNSENVSTAAPSPPHAELRVQMSLARAFWFVSVFFWFILERIRDLHINKSLGLDRLTWTSILIYWVLGLGWAGFIYVTFFGPGRSEREP